MAGGRPTVMTPETLQKLREAFLMGCTDEEACIYAHIAISTLYLYQSENPKFSEEKETLKKNPKLQARMTIYTSLSDKDMARWYMERKARDEFGNKVDVTVDSPIIAAGLAIAKIALKEDDYSTLADRIAARLSGAGTNALPRIVEGQVVETVQPLQDQGQAGQSNNVPAQQDPTPLPETAG